VLDSDHLPGFQLEIHHHPGYEAGHDARRMCAMLWRAEVDQAFLSEHARGPLRSTAVVSGTRLTRLTHAYTNPGSGSWVLLKCCEPGPFFIGFDVSTGAAEMFPRRYDVNGYAFALELLRVVTRPDADESERLEDKKP